MVCGYLLYSGIKKVIPRYMMGRQLMNLRVHTLPSTSLIMHVLLKRKMWSFHPKFDMFTILKLCDHYSIALDFLNLITVDAKG